MCIAHTDFYVCQFDDEEILSSWFHFEFEQITLNQSTDKIYVVDWCLDILQTTWKVKNNELVQRLRVLPKNRVLMLVDHRYYRFNEISMQ